MAMWYIIIVFFVTGIFVLYHLIKWKYRPSKEVPAAIADTASPLQGELPQEEVWWSQLDTLLQLEMAIALARKALPAWQKYYEKQEPVYRNAASGSFTKINQRLLQTALSVIEEASLLKFPEMNNKYINHCYNEFVTALIALQDGEWTITYAAKKLFLALYNILKAIKEQENIIAMKGLLSLSINQSLDCLDMSKLYSKEEIKLFLQSYRDQTIAAIRR